MKSHADDIRSLPTGSCHKVTPERLAQIPNNRRVAIVIGNGAYQSSIGTLENGPNDAVAMTDVLLSLGFEVMFGRDLSQKAIDDCINIVQSSKDLWNIIAFHYSGHGIQINDENYLVGIDTTELTSKMNGLRPLQPIIDRLQAHAEALIVFLDACRNNPFASAGQQGLSVSTARNIRSAAGDAQVMSSRVTQARGLLVAYATSPNAVATDGTGDLSPFTDALVSGLSTAGWSIQRALSYVSQKVGEATQWGQTPWSKSSLASEIKLNGDMTLEEMLSQSEAWARRSADYLDHGLRDEAISAALFGLPSNLSVQNRIYYDAAYLALYNSVTTMRTQFPDADRNEGNVFSPDRKYVFRAGERRPYQVWDVREKQQLLSIQPTGSSGGGTVDWAPDSATVAIVTGDGWVSVARVPSGEIVAKFNGSVAETKSLQQYAHVDSLSFDKSGRFLVAAGGYLDPIKIFDNKSGKLVRAFSQGELRKMADRLGFGYNLNPRAKMLTNGNICAAFSSGPRGTDLTIAMLPLVGNGNNGLYRFKESSVSNFDCTEDGKIVSMSSNSIPDDPRLTIISLDTGKKLFENSGLYIAGFFNASNNHFAAWRDGVYQYIDLNIGEIVNLPGAPEGYVRKSWGVYSTSGRIVGFQSGYRYLDVWSKAPSPDEIIEAAFSELSLDVQEDVRLRRVQHPAKISRRF